MEEETVTHLLPSADLPWKMTDTHNFIELPGSAESGLHIGLVKPQIRLCRHFMMELRTSKTGNNTVMYQVNAAS